MNRLIILNKALVCSAQQRQSQGRIPVNMILKKRFSLSTQAATPLHTSAMLRAQFSDKNKNNSLYGKFSLVSLLFVLSGSIYSIASCETPKKETPAAQSQAAPPPGAHLNRPPTIGSGKPIKRPLKLFTGNANPQLANAIAKELGCEMGKATVSRFEDGEVNVVVHENVRGQDVYIIQSTCPPVNENLMELMLMVSTMRRASARRITAVIPYYGYARYGLFVFFFNAKKKTHLLHPPQARPKDE